MTAQHTPGPWRIGQYDDKEKTFRILGRADASYFDCCPAFAAGRDRDGAEANARLIAAAPDLLAACKGQHDLIDAVQDVIRSYLPNLEITQDQALDEIIQLLDCPDERDLDAKARAAIAKAESGEQDDEMLADARLIAAAPDLLAALTDCGNALIDRLPSGHPDFAVVEKARVAIAKATESG